MKSMKKVISILLALVMCLSLLPMSAFAEDGGYATQADLDAAYAAALEALDAGVETGDTQAAIAAMDAYLAVYDRLSPEDQAANAEAYQSVASYRETLVNGNYDEDIDPTAYTWSSPKSSIKCVPSGFQPTSAKVAIDTDFGGWVVKSASASEIVLKSLTKGNNDRWTPPHPSVFWNGVDTGMSYNVRHSRNSYDTASGASVQTFNNGQTITYKKIETHTHSYSYSWYSNTQHKYSCDCGTGTTYSNHDKSYQVSTSSPTCTTPGSTTWHCNTCNSDWTETGSALGHLDNGSWLDNNAQGTHFAGCTSTNHKKVCGRCGVTLQTLDHSYDNPVVSGNQSTKTCTVCGHSVTETIQAQEADYKVEWYDTLGNTIKAPETRTGNVGDTVRVTSDDAQINGYTYDSANPDGVKSATLAASGTVLKLYFYPTVRYPGQSLSVGSKCQDYAYHGNYWQGDYPESTDAFAMSTVSTGTDTNGSRYFYFTLTAKKAYWENYFLNVSPYAFNKRYPTIQHEIVTNNDLTVTFKWDIAAQQWVQQGDDPIFWFKGNLVTYNWLDADGKVCETLTQSACKPAPEYPGTTLPQKPDDDNTYEFKGWKEKEDNDPGTITYEPEYTPTPKVIDDGKGITVTKTPVSAAVKVGETARWNIVVTNLSNVKKTVTLTDPTATLSKNTVTLDPAGQPGASETVTAELVVTEANVGELTNRVTADTGNAPKDPAHPETEKPTVDSDPITVKSGISVEKRLVPKDDGSAYQAGDTLVWEITVTNSGPARVSGLKLTDNLSSGQTVTVTGESGFEYTNFGLDGGQSTTFTAKLENAGEGRYVNTAVVSKDGKELDEATTSPVNVGEDKTTFIVTFCANGGAWKGDEVDPNADLTQLHRAVTVKPGETVKPMEDPELANFKPDTWYTADGKKFDFSTPIASDIELFAHWTPVTTSNEPVITKEHTSATGEAKVNDLVMYQIVVANAPTRFSVVDNMPVGLEMPKESTYALTVIAKDGKDITLEFKDKIQFSGYNGKTDEGGQQLGWWIQDDELPEGSTVILGYCAKVNKVGRLLNTANLYKLSAPAGTQVASNGEDNTVTYVLARAYSAMFAANIPTGEQVGSDDAVLEGVEDKDPNPDDPNPDNPNPDNPNPDKPNPDNPNPDNPNPDNPNPDNPNPDNPNPDNPNPDNPNPDPGPVDIPDEPTPTGPAPSTPNTPGEVEIDDPATPLASANGLNSVDHFAYIIGYDDGTVRPENNITRAEVATIFFRLMTDVYRAANWSTTNDFSDVAAGSWYNNAISTCAKAGLVNGYSDGTFKPDQSITRAEFATIAARFLDEEITGAGASGFADIEGHWAETNILRAAEAGWVNGDNGRFRPDDYISRAEVMTIVNRMLNRVPDADHLLPEMKTWSDNPKTAWYYEAVQEATNEHAYEWIDENVENWTELLTIRDWAALEKEWATEYSAQE